MSPFRDPSGEACLPLRVSREVLSSSSDATEAIGERVGRQLRRGDLLLLTGGLGAGKTTFVRGLARGVGASGDVMSPTFQLVRLYGGPLPLAHVDLYRLTEAGELSELGLDELLDEGAVVVEWGERLEQPGTARIGFELVDENRRRLRLEEGPTSWSF